MTVRRLLAVVALLGMLVAPPVLLLAFGFTDWGEMTLWSVSDVRTLLALLTVVGWLAWVAFVVAVVLELIVAFSGRRLRIPTPGLGAPRAVASALIGVVLAAGATSVAQATPALAAPAPAAAPVTPATTPLAPAASTTDDAAELSAQSLADATAARAGVTHRVQTGDDLWSLSERYYGDGTQWRQIVAANSDTLGDPLAPLPEGADLFVPTPYAEVSVVAGDTLRALAGEHLGDESRWPEIHELNRERIKDPDLIRVGWVLKVPRAVDAAASPQPSTDRSGATAPDAPPPTATTSSAAPAPTVEPPVVEVDREAEQTASEVVPEVDAASAVGLVGGLTALTAGAVLGGLAVRRRVQEHSRPLGRRFVQPDGGLARYEVALGQVADEVAGTGRQHLVARAMRRLAQHWWQQGEAAPTLTQVVVGTDDLTFTFAEAASAPDGFARLGDTASISWAALGAGDDPERPVAYPALVTLGRDDAGDLVMVDAVGTGLLGIRHDDEPGGATDVLSALLVELACSPWADELDLLVVTDDPTFARAAGEGRIACETDAEAAVDTVERLAQQRLDAMGDRPWNAGRLDPDLASAWAPQIVLFESALDDGQATRLRAAIEGRSHGVAAIAPVRGEVATGDAAAAWTLWTGADGVRHLRGDGDVVVPQTLPSDARASITHLFDLATSTADEPAPWWSVRAPEEDVNIIALHPLPQAEPVLTDSPRLRLLGPIDLEGCRGTLPSRAVRQCVEYAAWLLLHPGGTPAQMCQELLVAEGTRRSNVSRLRSWLGVTPEGDLFLPDAYSGRLELHSDVTSDWHDFSLLVSAGMNRQPLERLVAALDLVRGAPLADAAPGQWGWAEEFRSDVSAQIRDAGVLAARLARQRGDLDTSRWAANRALAAAPDDELLLGERIRTEQAAGRPDEVHRLVQRVTRTARVLGVDLLPETIDLCQEVVEGRRRARA